MQFGKLPSGVELKIFTSFKNLEPNASNCDHEHFNPRKIVICEPKPDESDLKKSRSQADKFKPKFATKVDLSFKCSVLYFCLESESTVNVKCTARFPLTKAAANRQS